MAAPAAPGAARAHARSGRGPLAADGRGQQQDLRHRPRAAALHRDAADHGVGHHGGGRPDRRGADGDAGGVAARPWRRLLRGDLLRRARLVAGHPLHPHLRLPARHAARRRHVQQPAAAGPAGAGARPRQARDPADPHPGPGQRRSLHLLGADDDRHRRPGGPRPAGAGEGAAGEQGRPRATSSASPPRRSSPGSSSASPARSPARS